MYPDPTTLAQMHLQDLRREAARAQRDGEHLRAIREAKEAARAQVGTEKSPVTLVVRLRRIHLWPQAGLREV